MNRKYLEEYEQKEKEEFVRFQKKAETGSLMDKYPNTERFIKIQEPVAIANPLCKKLDALCAQIPFSGSLIFSIPVCSQSIFEKFYFKTSQIQDLIEFTKEEGRLQFCLQAEPTAYTGLDYLDPFFEELRPPVLYGIPISMIGNEDEFNNASKDYVRFATTKNTSGHSFFGILRDAEYRLRTPHFMEGEAKQGQIAHFYLKKKCPELAYNLEQLLTTDPKKAWVFIRTTYQFLIAPEINVIATQHNFSLNEYNDSNILPVQYRPKAPFFPCEIGKFLIKKMPTYSPNELNACKQMMHLYQKYDLSKVQKALNEGIVTKDPDSLTSNVDQLSTILDNIWMDKTLPNRIKGVRAGISISMAVIGAVLGTLNSGPTTGGFLAMLGYELADKLIDNKEEKICEPIAKLTVKNYQANVFEFRKDNANKLLN
jgi:hypothetical protein